MTSPINPILMGKDNHNGAKLDNHLSHLMYEILGKCQLIVLDESEEATSVLNNNLAILSNLLDSRGLQISSQELLDDLASNEGPEGKPRIGKIRSYDGIEYDPKKSKPIK